MYVVVCSGLYVIACRLFMEAFSHVESGRTNFQKKINDSTCDLVYSHANMELKHHVASHNERLVVCAGDGSPPPQLHQSL